MKIAILTPQNKNDYMTDTMLDGLIWLKKESNNLEFCLPKDYPTDLDVSAFRKEEEGFYNFAQVADIIFFMWGKNNTDYDLANKINRFDKTVFIDGSEVGGDRRYDKEIERQIINGQYEANGKIDEEMLKKCKLYFRREKPYTEGVLPLPFGIESKYLKYYSKDFRKDIDFFCVFGQEEYPVMRRLAKEYLISFCHENGFTCFTEKTDQDNFYKMLARSKVGVSVGGGGYDTARFWEILGNNCLLLTEKIAIYEPDSQRLNYKRIWQFGNLKEFGEKLEKIGNFIKTDYNQENLEEEYEKIIKDHSSKSRVLEIINKFNG